MPGGAARSGRGRAETCGAGGVGRSRAEQAAADGAARRRRGRATGVGGGGWSARVAKKQSEPESEDGVESRPVAFATPASCQHGG